MRDCSRSAGLQAGSRGAVFRVRTLEPVAAIGHPPTESENRNGRGEGPPERKSEIGHQTQDGESCPEDLSFHLPQSIPWSKELLPRPRESRPALGPATAPAAGPPTQGLLRAY